MMRSQLRPSPNNEYRPSISPELALKRLQRQSDQAQVVRSKGRDSADLSIWLNNIKIILADFYGEQSATSKAFRNIWFTPQITGPGTPQSVYENAFKTGLDEAEGFLRSRITELHEKLESGKSPPRVPSAAAYGVSRNVFLVHGHDIGTTDSVARFLEKLELNPIVLHEQADQGRTIIEKFENHASDVGCAIVILTADDIGSSRAAPEKTELRARQNVILELGFFVGKLGRERTFALVQKDITLPSDFHGVVYIPLEDGDWRLRLVKELKAARFEIDANKAFE